MTNEQLAVLLSTYHVKLTSIIDNIRNEIEVYNLERHVEYHYEWIGEGDEPDHLFRIKALNPNYKEVETFTGDLVVLDELKKLTDLVAHQIQSLNPEYILTLISDD